MDVASEPTTIAGTDASAAATAAAASLVVPLAAASASSPPASLVDIATLPEQSLGCKHARPSSAYFCWMSILATVEVQLVLRCLDPLSRLAAARCNRQLCAAASHPFAWPQEQMATLCVANEAAALQSLGARVRESLLRSSSIRLRVQLGNARIVPLCPEVFAVANVRTIRVHQGVTAIFLPADFLLPSCAIRLRNSCSAWIFPISSFIAARLSNCGSYKRCPIFARCC
jgi:hypothetical protein